MPGKLKVRVVAGRNLPVMDRSSELTDAFVEVKFGTETQKTDVCRKSLDPQWNSEWFRFEVDDEELQDEPLQIRVLDHDTYSSHDAIGKLYIDLDPLLNKGSASVISGWFPIYDTMHGIRGELNVIVKVELFTDFNKFRQSSCGVQFFCTSGLPAGFRLQAMQGFVEELVVNDDPEYQWIDKIRSMRASNEARQLQFSKLTGELQRKIGLKVLEMGGNSVIGYHQCFDLEGESGLTVRAIGTSVLLSKVHSASPHVDNQSPGRESGNPPPSAPAVLLHPNFTSRPRLHSLPLVPTIHLYPSCGEGHRAANNETCSGPEKVSRSPVTDPQDSNSSPLAAAGAHASFRDVTHRSVSLVAPGKSADTLKRHSCDVIPPLTPKTPDMAGGGAEAGEYWRILGRSPPFHFDFSSNAAPSGSAPHAQQPSPGPSSPTRMGASPIKLFVAPHHGSTTPHHGRHSSESDVGTPPKGGSLTGSAGSAGGSASKSQAQHLPPQQSIDILEYPFFTIKSFPENFVVHLGGVVSARSVKLLDRIHNPDEPETRDAWWTELRTEVRSHAKAMGCTAVVGYVESTTICDEIIILSASGTAAVVNMDVSVPQHHHLLNLSGDSATLQAEKSFLANKSFEQEKSCSVEKQDGVKKLHVDVNLANQNARRHLSASQGESVGDRSMKCSIAHIPYNEQSLPFPVALAKCAVCRQHKVPDVLFSTVEYIKEVPIVGKGCFIQARICRAKKEAKGETNAKEISDSLKFMEYDLHNQLLNKLKIKGMNMLYGLRITFCVGDTLLVVVATATAVYVAPLPGPPLPQFTTKLEPLGRSASELQRKLNEAVHANKDLYNLHPPDWLQSEAGGILDEGEEEALNDLDFSAGNKESFVLQVDDAEDEDQLSVLFDPVTPDGFDICNTQVMPGVSNVVCNLQTFTKVWRGHLSLASNKALSNTFNNILRSVFFKLRKMTPCVLCHLDFDIDLPEEDEIQISVTGTCAGVGEPPSASTNLMAVPPEAKNTEEDMMFDLEMSSEAGATSAHLGVDTSVSTSRALTPKQSPLPPKRSALPSTGLTALKHGARVKYHVKKKLTPGVELSPLSYIPAAAILGHLGHLNFFIVRESTSVREEGGLNGFLHSFIAEVMAICRAHVCALGGNALVAYQMSECVVEDNLHKNQSQCLVNVYGDVVQVMYETEP